MRSVISQKNMETERLDSILWQVKQLQHERDIRVASGFFRALYQSDVLTQMISDLLTEADGVLTGNSKDV